MGFSNQTRVVFDVCLCACVQHTCTYFDLRELSLWAVVKVQVSNVCTNVREAALDVGRSVLMYVPTYNTYTKNVQ